MQFPWANVALLLLLLLQFVTGYLGFVSNQEPRSWLLWLHGIGAYAIVLVLFWKGAIIWDVLGRGKRWTPARAGFLLLTALLLGTLVLGLLWTFVGLEYLLGFSLLSLHIYLAVPLLLLMAFHFWRMRWILGVERSRDRRAFLRVGLFVGAGAVFWRLGRWAGQSRRFTGSYEVGSFGGWFPRVSWINDDPKPIPISSWRLTVDGHVDRMLSLSYEELVTLAEDGRTAALDCTGGWYTIQEWQGLSLNRLLDAAIPQKEARSVLVRSMTGYWRRFSLEEAESYLLALNVAGEPLSHGHGFPARLVAHDKRGYAWVKWVTEIRVEQIPPLWQPPLPLE